MLNEFVLVAVLTLPNTGNTVYEVQDKFSTMQKCNVERVKASKAIAPYRTEYFCLPVSKD